MQRVLVVDDDPVTRAVLRVMLERLDLAVDEADGVVAAHTKLDDQNVHFVLVFCDYLMPDANGLDLLENHPELEGRFVLITGTAVRGDLGDDRVDNVSAYLTKPVGSDELRTVVHSMLEDAPAPR